MASCEENRQKHETKLTKTSHQFIDGLFKCDYDSESDPPKVCSFSAESSANIVFQPCLVQSILIVHAWTI